MRISVVIPVYNREQHLPKLFSSIKKIKGVSLEFVFVDNGSVDNSYHLCQEFGEQQSDNTINIRVITENRKGASVARNAGMKICSGDYIYFFDSDDELSPHFFCDCMNHEGKDLIVCNTLIVSNGKEHPRKTLFPLTLEGHILSSTLSTQSFMIKRSLIEKTGGWDEDLPRWNDWELGIRIMLQRPDIAYLNKTYHRILQHSDSITGKDFAHSYEDLMKALQKGQHNILVSRIDQAHKTKALNALSAKTQLLSAWLYRENRTEMSEHAYNFSRQIQTSGLFKFFSPPLHFLSKKGIRGTWLLYNKLL